MGSGSEEARSIPYWYIFSQSWYTCTRDAFNSRPSIGKGCSGPDPPQYNKTAPVPNNLGTGILLDTQNTTQKSFCFRPTGQCICQVLALMHSAWEAGAEQAVPIRSKTDAKDSSPNIEGPAIGVGREHLNGQVSMGPQGDADGEGPQNSMPDFEPRCNERAGLLGWRSPSIGN